jgi:predicted MPP superfamily phosphohydrolase
MTPTLITLLILGALGHAILWVAAVNRLHATAVHQKLMDALTGLSGLAVTLIPLAVAAALLRGDGLLSTAAWSYVALCAVVCVVAFVHRAHTLLHPERTGVVLSNHTSHHRAADKLAAPLTAPGLSTWLSRLPGNQVLNITVHEKQLAIPRLAAGHDGLRIVHLSDFHMSGRIAKPYFEAVVDEVNGTHPDIVAITGDLVERNHCIDWIPDTLGRLRAPGGVYYVLGNHDRRVDVGRLKQVLADAGLVNVGGTCHQIAVRDTPLILAGNELPWFGPAADLTTCPPHDAAGLPLRIVLAHSPDRFRWAQANDVDLMLAGHNHGGQVRLPFFGPILAPSLHGVRYAAGAFRNGNTILHVSRGTASLTPLRWNCPPEIAVLVLRSAN